jgi:hypothetical protein
MIETSTIKIATWLPVFPGFYNTIFEPDLRSELEYLKQEGELPDTADEGDLLYGWDNSGYEQAVVRNICHALTASRRPYFPDEAGVIACEFEHVVSPKEYNFANDSANVTFEIDMALFAPWVRQLLVDYEKAWADYLRRHYKSCDGFISYYSYDPEDWRHSIEAMLTGIDLVETEGEGWRKREIVTPDHLLGRLLEFYLTEVRGGDVIESMYYDATESVYVGEFIDLEKVKQKLKEE